MCGLDYLLTPHAVFSSVVRVCLGVSHRIAIISLFLHARTPNTRATPGPPTPPRRLTHTPARSDDHETPQSPGKAVLHLPAGNQPQRLPEALCGALSMEVLKSCLILIRSYRERYPGYSNANIQMISSDSSLRLFLSCFLVCVLLLRLGPRIQLQHAQLPGTVPFHRA